MRGELIRLDRIRGDADIELLVEWASTTTGAYSSGQVSFFDVASFREVMRSHGSTQLMIRSNEDDSALGSVSWERLAHQDSYTVGVAIGDESQWGGGMGMEAMILLFTHLFHGSNARRVQVQVAAYNRNMLMVFTSGICQVEGLLRDYYYMDGAYHDGVIGSMLRDEFYALAEEWSGGPPHTVRDADKESAARTVDMLFDRPVDLLAHRR